MGVGTMTWWAIVPPVLLGAVIVLLPGLVIAFASSARGVTMWGLAPGLSLTVYTVVGVLYGVPHLPFTLGTVAIGAVVLVAVVSVIARLVVKRLGRNGHEAGSSLRDPRLIGWVSLAAVVIAFVAIAVRFAVVFGHPDAVSQTFDVNFHLNGVRYIVDTADASPLTFSDLQYATNGLGSFYPNLWHMVAALIAEASGASIPVVANAFAIVIGGLIWPLSCLLLMRQLLGRSVAAMVTTGILSAGFTAFPLLFVGFGVLYPNLLGMAVVPACLGVIALACGRATDPTLPRTVAWLLLLALIPGLALAHPNALVTMLGIAAPLLGTGWLYWIRGAKGRVRVLAWVLAAAVVLGYAAVFVVIRPPAAAATWHPTLGPWRALFNAAVNAQFGPPAIVISVLAIVGAVAALVKRRHRWLIVATVLVDVLYVATAYLPLGDFRYWVTGIWYSDIYRIVAMTPLVLLPLSVIGTLWLGELLGAVVARSRGSRTPPPLGRAVLGSSLVLAVVFGVCMQAGPAMTHSTQWANSGYQLNSASILLTADERALIDRVAGETPEDAVVVGDPWTGTALVWALADRRALVPHIYVSHTADTALILKSLRHATPGSAVCKAVKAEHVTYALDFGDIGVFGKTTQYPGVHHLNRSPALTLVDHQGDAALYRITGCD
ncbi:DUF6541 family protein [Humibacter ginsenosidimutans]|uniref:Uncharacterized protein n=1 Tax=Humibacter ginsenosidimutans TaxID=2599293 RepID=A0A5B8MAA7_9MICO|nr:DUF6541 family protein [Humibacter ginsenosidimutans]QDZ16440.1 hypothetical protein FPZ11_18305 [Humibacter ginsenosidimutans]